MTAQVVNAFSTAVEWQSTCPKAFSLLKDIDGKLTVMDTPSQGPKKIVYPVSSVLRYVAFRLLKPKDVKVIILGQDPYHDGSATGLAFDNLAYSKTISPSLRNILKEREDDGYPPLAEGKLYNTYLENWPKEGVLLLNTALTVEKGKPGSHAELWRPFTEALISEISEKLDNVVWILWGRHAQSYKYLIDNETHRFITSAHPSPFSANKGFFGSQPFSMANKYLEELDRKPVKW